MNKATRLTASILCGLSLSTIAQIASAGDQIHVNKRGDLVIRLGDHNSYRLLSLYSTGIPNHCLLYTSPSPRDLSTSRMPSSA